MESQQKIDPERVTKPIQLLAAWLVGLIVVDGGFLFAAGQMAAGSWERGALVVAAIANVPVFLFALFLLQTRFRPELQEDSYYSQYLDKRTNKLVTVGRDESVEKELIGIRSDLRLLAARESTQAPASQWRWKLGLNRMLPDFSTLRDLLKKADIPLDDAFAADEAPDVRAMALADYLDFETKLQMLRLAIDMKLVAYGYFDPKREDIDEDVLIGSYGLPSYAITPELAVLIDSGPEPVDLQIYEAEHRWNQQVGSQSQG